MNYKERFFAALQRKPVDRVPIAIPTANGVIAFMEHSGSFFPDAHRIPEIMAGLAIGAHECAGIESVRVPFDICVEAEACGCPMKGWVRDSQPIAMPFISTPEDLPKFKKADPAKDGRMPVVIEAVKILKKKVGDKLPIIAALGSPFEVVSTMWDSNTLFMSLYDETEDIMKLVDEVKTISIRYAQLLVEAGADVLMIVDGNSQNLGPNFFPQYSGDFTKAVVKAVDRPTILHICGGTTPLLEQMADTGVTGLSIDAPVNVKEAKEKVGDRVALVGNVAPNTLFFGKPEEVFEEAKKAVENGIDVLSPGCGFIPETPLPNVKALVRAGLEVPKPK